MKVIEATSYKREMPELFTWGRLDSPKLASLASALVNEIDHSIRNDPDRVVVPGCRRALNYIAEMADF